MSPDPFPEVRHRSHDLEAGRRRQAVFPGTVEHAAPHPRIREVHARQLDLDKDLPGARNRRLDLFELQADGVTNVQVVAKPDANDGTAAARMTA